MKSVPLLPIAGLLLLFGVEAVNLAFVVAICLKVVNYFDSVPVAALEWLYPDPTASQLVAFLQGCAIVCGPPLIFKAALQAGIFSDWRGYWSSIGNRIAFVLGLAIIAGLFALEYANFVSATEAGIAMLSCDPSQLCDPAEIEAIIARMEALRANALKIAAVVAGVNLSLAFGIAVSIHKLGN